MGVQVDLDDLLAAVEWVSAGEMSYANAKAFVSRRNGAIHWTGEGVDEDPPADADDDGAYVAVPRERDLDLEAGPSLALDFVEKHLPRSLAEVEDTFRKKGAFSRFKSLLDGEGLLEKWHLFEEAAKARGLVQWCDDNGFTASRKPAGR